MTYQHDPLLWNEVIRATVWHPQDRPWSKKEDMAFYSTLAILPEQIHSSNVGIVESAGQQFPDTDALITFHAGIALGVVTADCVPIMLYASDVKGIAAIHAGWKGSLDGILDRALDILIAHGAAPENITAVFGPSICRAHYEVSVELAQIFAEAGFQDCVYWADSPGVNPHLDLQEVNRMRLLGYGVPERCIIGCDFCTYGSHNTGSESVLQSYRRDGASAGRNLTTIVMTKK